MLRSAPDSAPLLTPRAGVLAALIAITVAYRLLVFFVPGIVPYNFTPVEAMALFGGACFADRRLALAVPLAAMLCADLVIGASLPHTQLMLWLPMMPVIYACVALTALGGFALRGRVKAVNVALAAIAGATGFFLVTNFFTWLISGMYAMSVSGLVACYLAALPFYQYGTLAGSLLWSAVLFGGFALLSRRYGVLTGAAQPA